MTPHKVACLIVCHYLLAAIKHKTIHNRQTPTKCHKPKHILLKNCIIKYLINAYRDNCQKFYAYLTSNTVYIRYIYTVYTV